MSSLCLCCRCRHLHPLDFYFSGVFFCKLLDQSKPNLSGMWFFFFPNFKMAARPIMLSDWLKFEIFYFQKPHVWLNCCMMEISLNNLLKSLCLLWIRNPTWLPPNDTVLTFDLMGKYVKLFLLEFWLDGCFFCLLEFQDTCKWCMNTHLMICKISYSV